MRNSFGVPVVVILSLATLLMAQDCGRVVTIVQRFDLAACPGQSFTLPGSVVRAPYRLLVAHERNRVGYGYAMCPGFVVYNLREGRKDRLDYRVRFTNHGPTCGIDVGYTYLGSLKGLGRVATLEDRLTPSVEAVARLLMPDSSVAPRTPAAQTLAFFSDSAFQAWCRTSVATNR